MQVWIKINEINGNWRAFHINECTIKIYCKQTPNFPGTTVCIVGEVTTGSFQRFTRQMSRIELFFCVTFYVHEYAHMCVSAYVHVWVWMWRQEEGVKISLEWSVSSRTHLVYVFRVLRSQGIPPHTIFTCAFKGSNSDSCLYNRHFIDYTIMKPSYIFLSVSRDLDKSFHLWMQKRKKKQNQKISYEYPIWSLTLN